MVDHTLTCKHRLTITYVYDPLKRLKEANYSNGDYYHYTYDAVGNRLSQVAYIAGNTTTTTYDYDNANRLLSVDGVTYTYDNNGNLKNDGVNAYDYDSANRLKSFNGPGVSATYTYNGLGDRLQETVNGVTTTFTMDLNTGLTQALSDGTNHYIYGLGRIAQVNTTTEYFLGDALGSVRQLTDASGEITYSRAYDPYGVVSSTGGTSQSAYGYTGESYGDSTELLYLRSRFYASGTGRFLTRDTWGGDYDRPLSFNRWMYVEGNPVNLTDPSGYTSSDSLAASCAAITSLEKYTFLKFGVSDTNMKGWTCDELEQVLDEVDQFDRAVNGGLSSIFTRTISVKRVNKDKWCAYYYWYGTIEVQNPFTTKCAAGTLGHELAHAWDNQQGISSKFAKYVGASKSWGKYNVGNETPPLYGGGDPPSAFEDFAESVTEYVYDQKDQERIPTTEKRWKFVETLLDTGTILTSTSNTTSSNCSPTALGALESLWN